MVGPERKRQAVLHVQHELEVSERRACRATRQPRSTQRYHLKRLEKDKARIAEEILRQTDLGLSVQVLQEFYTQATRSNRPGALTHREALDLVRAWQRYPVQEITVPGGLGDTTAPHLPQAEFAFGAVVSGAEEMRRCVRMFCKYGVDSLKINLSGESITGMPSEMSQFTEEEIRVCVEEAKAWGKRVAAHARSTWSIKQCVKQGIEVIYHASFADEEALDLLEAHKFDHFVAPGLAWLINTSYHASAWGLTPEITRKMGYHRELEAAIESMKAMRRRGIRILPGGDYGFAWTPHGTNAKDLEYFVKYIGMSPMEALLSATAWGGPMMKLGKEIGYIREGCLADILLIDGDPFVINYTAATNQLTVNPVVYDVFNIDENLATPGFGFPISTIYPGFSRA
ncbi:MAG: hypothetical protein EBW55_11000, partial [Betaproteobacteria bacterium]|nr:hypothetical protein [Betaproteobacteria bacterium]